LRNLISVSDDAGSGFAIMCRNSGAGLFVEGSGWLGVDVEVVVG
jgi:hypothetical protein